MTKKIILVTKIFNPDLTPPRLIVFVIFFKN